MTHLLDAASSLKLYGPAGPQVPLLLDSPHSGHVFPLEFDAIVSEHDLRDGEDAFVPSGKAELGKALIWRTLDDGRPIYARKLAVAEVLGRIERCHAPYHRALQTWIDATHQRFGASYHLNCHSMNAHAGVQGEGGAGSARADFVLGDRDGSTCASGFTAFVHEALSSMGYDVKVNDPYKGVELVRAYSDPAQRRHSLQLEINKRLYMDEPSRTKHAGFETLQKNLQTLIDALLDYTRKALS